ncbi:putative multidrug resistance protein EmrK [compost metagenome]|jgi:membrane fusion protein (multidrug efflux system)|uniref:Efflux transporter periplasmic adaptor subunit n=1 Tax=Pseudomonas reinekei TaxID=395598 RepID=A0A1H0T1K4_PSERE|nr:HlyD family efflux transporter periplasmic adaptor subunit [Pseudomonas reinekei]KAB0482011.1 HlyD family efflux transporter periplasmic adaptor subunit [Pseudomonas reinekei]OLT99939.1 efflux transporter periplasmic adaptor subunit [Pseudomonas reinekei]SDP47923.1 membrane fusion protein, multidrug efflux system [Pseudomonas reinekei]
MSTIQAPTDATKNTLQYRRKKLFRFAILGFGLVACAYAGWKFFFAGNFVTTENAYTAAESAQITPLIAGPVKEVRVSDTQFVKAGDVLVVLDDTDAQLNVAQALSEVARTERHVRELLGNDVNYAGQIDLRSAQIAAARSDLSRFTASYDKALVDERRRHNLAAVGAISQEELTNAQTRLREAQAALGQAKASIRVAEAAYEAAKGARQANLALVEDGSLNSNPAVLTARAKLGQAKVNLERTVLRAPFDGVIAQRVVEIGQQVQLGARLMTVVPIDKIYVDANFKEGQLQRVHPGQSVELTADIYGDNVIYKGVVVGFAGGSGSAFSAIPAQNATGNWIKVVQRLPVRISLDREQIMQHPLRVGLSMQVSVDVSDKSDQNAVVKR